MNDIHNPSPHARSYDMNRCALPERGHGNPETCPILATDIDKLTMHPTPVNGVPGLHMPPQTVICDACGAEPHPARMTEVHIHTTHSEAP